MGSLDENSDVDDVFNLDLVPRQRFWACIDGPAETDFDLQLFSPQTTNVNSQPLLRRATGTTYPDCLCYTVPDSGGGTYFLNAKPSGDRFSGDYTITWAVDDNQDGNITGVPLPQGLTVDQLDELTDCMDVFRFEMSPGT
jgi:hypothetical protein